MTRYADISTERTAGFLGGQVTQAALDDVGQIEGPMMSLTTRDYCGGHVYMDGRLERTLQPWGDTDADGADYFYITDYLGNVRTVTDRHGYACELNAYYPYGALMNTLTGNGTEQPYKYSGKELDRTAGLDLYDSQARFYDPVLGRTTTVDPKSAAYAGTSHYGWCAGNPVRFVDPDGEDIVVLNFGNDPLHQHLAMLIQSQDGKWQYYSVNGNNVYVSGMFAGGRPFNDVAQGSWDSPQEFLDSSYNERTENSKKDKENKNNFGFEEGYQIPTTPEQDAIMRKEFKKIAQSKYNLLTNNCAHAVQKTMIEAEIPVSEPTMIPSYIPVLTQFGIVDVFNGYKMKCDVNIVPSFAFRSIMKWNPQGSYIHKKNEQ